MTNGVLLPGMGQGVSFVICREGSGVRPGKTIIGEIRSRKTPVRVFFCLLVFYLFGGLGGSGGSIIDGTASSCFGGAGAGAGGGAITG